VPVNLGPRSYRVDVGSGLLKSLGAVANEKFGIRANCVVITNGTVGPIYAKSVMDSLEAAGKKPVLIQVASGEDSKSMRCAEDICSKMALAGLDRKSFIIALGGGVIGDLAGFCAGVYQRGIPFIQVPTTVLSMVDSSVGGKTGVNLPEAKNMVGVFHQPAHVIADIDTLKTLPKREWNSGFAEIIKHACIRDASMLPLIDQVAAGGGDLAELIRWNIVIKAAVVEEDEFETLGVRALLNFGHTLGHAIEASAGYGALLHGEAISLGLRAAALLSVKLSTLSAADAERIVELLRCFDLPVQLSANFESDELLRIARMDKKFEHGKIRFVLLSALGSAHVSHDVTEEHLLEVIALMREPV
ncbi:MAG: 3-dehydroquinate synthase, partial [Prosthecobacter sp.]